MHTEYVDNFLAMSTEQGAAADAARSVDAEFKGVGLRTHGADTTAGGTALGSRTGRPLANCPQVC